MRSLAITLFALCAVGLYAQEETSSSTKEESTTQEVSASEKDSAETSESQN